MGRKCLQIIIFVNKIYIHMQIIIVTNKIYVRMYVCTYIRRCVDSHSALRKMLEEDEVLSAMESK